MNDQELLRFSRHILLDEIGIDLGAQLVDAPTQVAAPQKVAAPTPVAAGGDGDVDDLQARLDRLRK